jgi:formylglycine-generating enzyme required for sulfatase activity
MDTTKSGTAAVTITSPAVSAVTVSPGTVGVTKGGTRTFTATVAGTGNPAQTVTWTLSGGGAGTTISSAGVLTVAANETATSLTVTATSTVDTTKSGTAAVTVLPPVTDLSYRDMALVTPDAVNSVTITGASEYDGGVFIANRTVSLSPFHIAKYETTYELWYTVYQWAIAEDRGAGKYTFANVGREGYGGTTGAVPTEVAKNEPVLSVSWRDVVIWCNAYSEMIGKTPVYRDGSDVILRSSSGALDSLIDLTKGSGKDGYRLPTEAEWEYAARGGGTPSTTGIFSYKWAGTNDESAVGTYAWYYINSGNTTHEVGGKEANSLGLYDMSGNLSEWCWDWYDTVSTGTTTDPTGPASGTTRVYRGGSWNGFASTVAARDSTYPNIGSSYIGFRVAAHP